MVSTIDMDQLNQLLRKVPDSYPDFVRGTGILFQDNPDALTHLTAFITEHPLARTGEIIAYMNQFLPIESPAQSSGHCQISA